MLVAAVGMYVMMLTLSTALSLRIASIDPAGKETVYGTAVSVGALLMLLTVPLGGALSDRTTSRFGRRRPWIIGCLVPTLLAMAVIGTVDSLPVIAAAYVVGIACAQAAFNAYAVIPVEGVPDNRRARVMGLMGLFGALAMSAGSYLAAALVGVPLLMMTVPVLLAILTTLPLLFLYKDPAKSKAEVPALNLRAMAKGFLVNPRKHPDFAWAWVSRFLAGVAMTALFSFFIYFMMDGLGLSIAVAGAHAGLLTLASAPVSVLFFTVSGWLSDKVGRRKPFVVVAALLMALALVVAATSTSFTQFLVAWVIFAIGSGDVPHRRPRTLRRGAARRQGRRQGHGGLRARPQHPEHHRPGARSGRAGHRRRPQLRGVLDRRGRALRARRLHRHPDQVHPLNPPTNTDVSALSSL